MFAMVDFQDGSLVEVQYSAFFPASQHLEAMQIQIPHLIHQQSMQASTFDNSPYILDSTTYLVFVENDQPPLKADVRLLQALSLSPLILEQKAAA